MNTSKYFEKRAEKRLVSAEQKALRIENELKKVFADVYDDLEAEYAKIYFEFSDENGLAASKLKEKLNAKEKQKLSMKLEELLKKAKTPEERERLKYYYKKAITKLDSKMADFSTRVSELYNNNIKEQIASTLHEVYSSTMLETHADLCTTMGVYIAFSMPSREFFETLLENPWSGKNYSEKIWGHVEDFTSRLEKILTTGMIEGKSNQKMARELARTCDVMYKRAIALVRTETNYFANEASAKSYENCGIEKYKYLATLDLRTSEICRELDGKIFDLNEKKVGINYPPMHVHCRSTTVAIFSDELENRGGKRIARDLDGRNYKEPAGMTYKEWYEKYVANNPKVLSKEKSIKKLATDKKQFEKYKEKLGKEMGNYALNLEEFQDLKYNKSEIYESIKRDAKVFKAIDRNKKIIFKDKAKEIYGDFRDNGVYSSDHFVENFMNREFANDERRNFVFMQVVNAAKQKINYFDTATKRDVRFYDELALISENEKFVTLMPRREVSEKWKQIL